MEQGIDEGAVRIIVAVDPEYFRPTEVETLLGEPTKAGNGSTGPKASFEELGQERVQEDLKSAERDSLCERDGFKAFNYQE